MDINSKLFAKNANKDVTLSDVFEKIYSNASRKDKQINLFLLKLQPLIEKPQDAILLIPVIKPGF